MVLFYGFPLSTVFRVRTRRENVEARSPIPRPKGATPRVVTCGDLPVPVRKMQITMDAGIAMPLAPRIKFIVGIPPIKMVMSFGDGANDIAIPT